MTQRALPGRGRTTIVMPASMARDRDRIEQAIESRARLLTDDEVLDVGALRGPTILVTGMSPERTRALIAAPGLVWVHSTSSGVDDLPLAEIAARQVLLTNSAGAHAVAMTEYAIGAMISLAHGMRVWTEGQRVHRWLREDATPVTLLHGKRLGIIGYGAVGRQLARAAAALGMGAWVVRRTPLFLAGEPVERMLGPAELHELLAASDFLVVCASLNTSSRHLIGNAEFASVRRGAFLINLARGDLVDERALASALEEGRLGGAALDVTSTEPLPPDSPLWDVPRLMLTPHVSGSAPESWQAVVDFLCENLRVFLGGAPGRLGNQVRYESVL
jgi:phosphoglycerate dehydrogenase-like enzyme